jgi:outer membrane protein, heavy metal efflux system
MALRLFCAAAAFAVAPATVAAQSAPDTLRLADAVAAARQANPMLQAARLEADAAAQRVPQAGALPDPQFQLGLMNRPLAGFGTMDPMTMNSFQLTQTLPWPGKLAFGQDRARSLAQAQRLDAAQTEADLIGSVSGAYYQLAYMDRALAAMGQTRELLRSFHQVASAMYGVGTGLQQDVLQAQVAVARMTEDITAMTGERVATAARLNALLGRDATAPVGALELPPAEDTLPNVDSLMALAAERRPALRAAHQRALAAAAGYREARREIFPDLMIGVSYGQRPRFDDMVSLMIGFSLPVWAGSRQLPLRREMQAMQAAQEAQARDLHNETYARLAELRAEAVRARNLSQLYATAILPQARASVDAALASYRVGQVNFMSLVENQMTVNRYAVEGVRLLAEHHKAVAEIGALLGAGLEESR